MVCFLYLTYSLAWNLVDVGKGFWHNKKILNAGIAQLVERNLAKVEVASSSLVSRSKFLS